MKYSKKYMNLEKGLKTEWIITNGLGGYAASSIIGANTRKYHGLLVAPLTPPARRFLVLSKLDESIEIVNKKYNIYTNIGKDYVTDGYKYQKYFEKSEIPVYYYEIEDVKIKKSICMQYGKNTVIVQYNIKNGEYNSKLTLAPVVNFRDFHTTNTNHNFKLKQNNVNTKLKLIIDKYNEVPIYMKVSEGKYIKHYDDIFKNMFYIEEEKRGFCAEEDHIVPGRYEIEIKPNEQKDITFICSLEENIDELDGKEVIKKEKNRIKSLIKNSELVQDGIDEDLIKTYIIASDNFVVYRPSFGLHTIIAGYPWFLDWGRDTLISFEGLLLISKRFDIAKEVLLTMIRDVKYGLVPNGYSGFDNRPLYNSVDSSLLLFEQVKKYLEYTKDEAFIKDNLYDILVKIIYSYIDGIDIDDNNIYMDKDYLIVSGTQNTQNTWMDAKVDGVAITPRNGKAVEVNSLWYNALKIMEEITAKFYGIKYAKQYGNLAKECKRSFESKFYQKRRKCLYDVLGDSKIRPNQLFALGLSYPILDCSTEEAKNCFETVTKKLLNLYGLKTLSKGEENYTEIYEGDSFRRDMSYHQGITWPWLAGLYVDAIKTVLKNEKDPQEKKSLQAKYNKCIDNYKKSFTSAMKEAGIGTISELYDSQSPYLPGGTISQAWSVSEALKIMLEK